MTERGASGRFSDLLLQGAKMETIHQLRLQDRVVVTCGESFIPRVPLALPSSYGYSCVPFALVLTCLPLHGCDWPSL